MVWWGQEGELVGAVKQIRIIVEVIGPLAEA